MESSYPQILRVSDLEAAGLDDRELRRRADHGELHRIAPGCYVPTDAWHQLCARDRYKVEVHTRLSRLSPNVIASHDSAAALWNLPTLDGWPSTVHVYDPARSKPLTRNGLVRHVGDLVDDEIIFDTGTRCDTGTKLTSPARTALDLALRDGFLGGLMLFDHGLRHHGFDRDELRASLDLRVRPRRHRAVLHAINMSSPLADSVGESLSRGQIILLGFEPPELQHRFYENGQEVARADFWWESVRVAGEFDGNEKYLSPTMRGGRSAAQVVIDEKWRTERLLDLHDVARVVRWNYRETRNPALLAERLSRAGVPRLGSARARKCEISPSFPAQPLPRASGVEPERRG
jgi:hypothetical protein